MISPGKSSPLGESWLILGAMALAGLLIAAPGSGSPPPRRAFRLVPEPFEMNHQMTEVAAIEKISRARIQEALRLIMSLEYDQALSTPEDEEIFRLLHQYDSGRRLYRTTARVVVSRNDSDSPTVGRMAFSCRPGHEYAYNPGVQTSTPFLALSLYHELKHGVQCLQGIELPDREEDRCHYEAPAYAAQVRFLVALHKKGMLPDRVSAAEPSDAGLMAQTLEAWEALSGGEAEFCRWYRRELRWGALVVLQEDP
jgi:hypothetical protein